MSSILGIQSANVGRTQSIQSQREKVDEKKQKEGRPEGVAPRTHDVYQPSAAAVAMSVMVEEEEATDEVFAEDADVTVDDVVVDGDEVDVDGEDLDIDGDEVDVDGDDLDIDGDEVDVDGDEVEEDTTTSDTAVDTRERVHGYVSSLTAEDRAMMQLAYATGQVTSLSSVSGSLFDYLDSSSTSGNLFTDMDSTSSSTSTSDYLQSIVDALASAQGDAGTSDVETEDGDVDAEDADTDAVDTDVESGEADL